ncbi:MAG: monovalent cation/H+ antiporter subunit D family protein [Gammaproteobacteria bacterium]|nr:monovalent cation/H+ antiporter subunit D family protein [Gammaproteobacteria bacterium]
MSDAALLLITVSCSLVGGIVIFLLPEQQRGWRTAINLGAALIKILCLLLIVGAVLNGQVLSVRLPFLPGADLVLRADAMSLLFAILSALLWLVTTIYAIGYLEGAPHRRRFFGFFSLCVTATMGIALAGNLITFFLFYELLTLTTYPLVVHRGTPKALAAGRRYLAYTLVGGVVLLTGVLWLQQLLGSVDFSHGGVVSVLADSHRPALVAIFALLIGGVAVKAAVVPLHGWLPEAMVAPAPVSALLHAVAVVKAGAFGVVRICYDVFGIEYAASLGVLQPLAVMAGVTILWGSLRALVQSDLKRRLAYSTISQASYIILGVALFGPLATIGGLVHLVHQGIMKITLFFCAGNYAETLGIHAIDQLDGVGQRMPLTTVAFTIGALGMIGVPATAGFVSKWYLGQGALAADMGWVLWLLLASSLLNAAYFLPLLHRAWFRVQRQPWPEEHIPRRPGRETSLLLLLPPLVTALSVVMAGLWAGAPFSPLVWAQLITALEYRP